MCLKIEQWHTDLASASVSADNPPFVDRLD